MAQPTQVEMPTYIIYRDIPPGQPFDPTAPLAFFPPKDSDELFDALRAKFPNLKNNSERMRQAVIEFLIEETPLDSSPELCLSTPEVANMASTFTSQYPAAFSSAVSSNNSTWSSPETVSLPTPSFGDSPRPLSRQFSVTTSTAAASEESPPGMENMTGVFSLTDSNQPKQRVRRKMTEQEKIEYRKRRIVKACDKCAKRKRKCNHNQQDMESLSSKSQKAPKSSAAPASKKPPAPNLKIAEPDQILAANPTTFVDTFGIEPTESFEDFSDFLEMPLPDLGLDDIFATSQIQWPWANTPDFTLMDTSGDSFATGPQMEYGYQSDQSPTDSFLSSESDKMYDQDITQQPIKGNRHVSSMIWEHLRTGQQPSAVQATQMLPENGILGSHASTHDETQQMRHQQYHEWNADNIHDSRRSLTEQHLQEGLSHINERAVGDGRRTTHSQTQQQTKSDTRDQTSKRQEPKALHETEQTNTASNQQIENATSNLETTKQSSHNIHTGLNLAKRKTNGIDASITIPGNQNKQQTSFSQENNSSSRQQPHSLGELGDGIIANTSPSTELFMLRRRIPKALHSIVDRNNVDHNSGSMSFGTIASPIQTRPQGLENADINASQIGLDTRRQISAGSRDVLDIADVTDTPTTPARTRILASRLNQNLASGITAVEDATLHTKRNEVHDERLSDHMRRRDHFGRHFGAGLQVLSAVAGLGCLLMLLSLLPSQSSNLSMLLLALTSADRGARGSHLSSGSTFWSEMWGAYVPTVSRDEHRDWWSQIKTRTSDFIRMREDTSSSTWVKETGKTSNVDWRWRSEKRRCGHAVA